MRYNLRRSLISFAVRVSSLISLGYICWMTLTFPNSVQSSHDFSRKVFAHSWLIRISPLSLSFSLAVLPTSPTKALFFIGCRLPLTAVIQWQMPNSSGFTCSLINPQCNGRLNQLNKDAFIIGAKFRSVMELWSSVRTDSFCNAACHSDPTTTTSISSVSVATMVLFVSSAGFIPTTAMCHSRSFMSLQRSY